MGDPDQAKSYLTRGGSFCMEALRRIADLAKALRLDSIAAAAHIFRGLAYRKKGDCDQTIAEYDKALDLALAYNNRGFAYHLAGCLLVVLVALLPLLVLALAYNYNNWGFAYLAGCFLAVLVLFLSSGLALAYNNRGFAYHLAGCFLAVLVLFLSLLGLALAWGPDSLVVAGPLLAVLVAVLPLLGLACIFRFRGLAVAYYSRGSTHVEQGDYGQAIDDCKEALRLKPKDAVAYKVRGDAYEKQRNYDKAIEDYMKAIELDPKYAAAYNNRGFAYDNRGDKGDYDRAITDYTKAIELNPKDAVAYNNRGFAHHQQEDYARAIEDYRKVIELKPNHAISYLNRADLYEDLMIASGKFDEDAFDRAIEDYDNTVRLCPDYQKDFMDREFAYGGEAAVETAVETLEMKIGKVLPNCLPERATYFYYLGVTSLFSNNRLAAWEYFVKAKDLGCDDRDNGKKLARHLGNLDDIRIKIEGNPLQIFVFSGKLGITEERLQSILTILTQDRD